MSDFALSLHLYEKSGSLYFYSYFSMFIILPEILFAPIIGHYIDKFNKKLMMLAGHFGAGLASVFILSLLQNNYDNIYIYLFLVIVSSLFNSLVFASFNVLIGSEIDQTHIDKASVMVQLGFGFVMISSPAIATSLLTSMGIESVFYIDIATFCMALVVISFMQFSDKSTHGKTEDNIFFANIKQSYRYIRNNELLWLSLILFSFTEFFMAQVAIYITPIVLSISSKNTLGIIMSIGGIGMFLGNIILLFVKIKKRLFWINVFSILQALIFLLAIFKIGVVEIGIGSFMFMLLGSFIGVLNYTYWQIEVDQDIKGKIFGFRRSIILSSIMLGYLSSAPMSHLMSSLIGHYPYISHIIGNYLHPEIRLLFILNSVLIIFIVVLIYKKMSQEHNNSLQSGEL